MFSYHPSPQLQCFLSCEGNFKDFLLATFKLSSPPLPRVLFPWFQLAMVNRGPEADVPPSDSVRGSLAA